MIGILFLVAARDMKKSYYRELRWIFFFFLRLFVPRRSSSVDATRVLQHTYCDTQVLQIVVLQCNVVIIVIAPDKSFYCYLLNPLVPDSLFFVRSCFILFFITFQILLYKSLIFYNQLSRLPSSFFYALRYCAILSSNPIQSYNFVLFMELAQCSHKNLVGQQ